MPSVCHNVLNSFSGARKVLATAVSVFALSSGLAVAEISQDVSSFNIESQALSRALMEFSRQSNLNVYVAQEVVQGKTAPSVTGEMSAEDALKKLIGDTGLNYKMADDGSVMLSVSASEDNPDEDSKNIDEAASNDQEDVDEEIIVTGSRIARVVSQMAANVIVLDNKALLASGAVTLQDALRQLPQNIFGASPTGAAVNGSGMSFNGALNITGASSINLRGLGSESTLVLVDGRRIGKSGVFGGISDITGIPLRAVDRVEIMLDGASSIYGSDAVGGVVNIIMKKDFEGSQATYEYASSDLGGFGQHTLTLIGNRAWDGGRVQGTFEHYRQTNLDGGERPERITNSDSFTSPGTLLSSLWRYQGEVVTFDELRQTFTATQIILMQIRGEMDRLEAILPPNQDGTNLSREDLLIFDSIPTVLDTGTGISLMPKQVHSTLRVNFNQNLQLFNRDVTLSGDLYYSERANYAANGDFIFQGLVPADHPYNPMPGSTVRVGWGLQDFADRHFQSKQNIGRWNLALDGKIGDSWKWEVVAGQSINSMDSLYINEAIDSSSAEYQALLDAGLNVLASDLFEANSPELLRELIAEPRDVVSINRENTFDIGADGTLWRLPGGDIHLAVGGGWRQEFLKTGSRIKVTQTTFEPRELGAPSRLSLPSDGFDDREYSRAQHSLYSELLVPVVSANNRVPGVQSLNLTASARYDSYQRQGSDSTWSLGMIWSPIDQVRVRVNHSTSYVVPTFKEQLLPVRVFDLTRFFGPQGRPIPLVDANLMQTGEVEFLGSAISGGNPDLKPETGDSFSAGIEITPDMLPGLTLNVTWSQTNYNNRIGAPPRIEEFVFTPEVSLALLANSGYDTKYGRRFFRGEDGLFVQDDRTTNTSLMERAGIDYQIHYNRDTDYGQFIATANVGYTSKFNTMQNPGDEPLNHLDGVNFQSRSVIPKYRYSTQLQWYYHGFSASLNASTSSKTTSEGRIGTITTRRIVKPPLNMALSISYDMDQGDLFAVPFWLQGTEISLRIPRLLNDTTEEEVIDVATGEPYVFAGLNANTSDLIGRMFNISLTKRF